MNLDPDPQTEAFRAEVRGWLTARGPDPPLPSVHTAEGFAAHREWERTLAGAGLAAVSWPERYGGRDATLAQWLVFEEEYYRAAAPVRVGQNGLFLLAPTLFAHGTAEQQDRILPPMATAEQVRAQAWSEPGAGSDLAAIRSAAVRTDGGWRLSGQKTWSIRAAFADRAFGLFRSDPHAERHRGLTYLMFDLRAPGVTVRPIAQLDGEPGFAEIFLDDVFVPDADVIGAPGEGWEALTTGPDAAAAVSRAMDYGTLASAALLLGAGRGLLEASTQHAKTREQFGRPVGAFQAVKHALADVLIGLEFARPLLYAAAIALGGNTPTTARDISAARVACAEAARRESDISLWLVKVRSLSSTWGSQVAHRAVVLAALTQDRAGAWS